MFTVDTMWELILQLLVHCFAMGSAANRADWISGFAITGSVSLFLTLATVGDHWLALEHGYWTVLGVHCPPLLIR